LYEKKIVEAFRGYLLFHKNIEIDPPFIVMLSLLNVKGVEMFVGRGESAPFDRNTMLFPEILLEEVTEKAEILLKPLFDMVWQSVGCPRSMNYDKEGNWIGGPLA